MRALVIRGGTWLTGQQAISLVTHLVLLVVLSRLLTPAEIGLAAILTALAGLVGILAEVGIGAALVQRPRLDEADVFSGLVYVAGAGTLLSCLLFLAVPPAFASLALGPVGSGLALLTAARCLSGPLASYALSLRQRELDFRGMALAVLAGNVPGQLGVSVALALLGQGAAAIVAGQLAANVLQFLVGIRGARTRLVPRFSWPALRGLLTFGTALTSARLALVVHQYVDRPLLGALLSPGAVGHYVRADQLGRALDLAVQPLLSSIGFPVMARLQQDPVQLRAALETGVAGTLVFTVPAALALSLAADAVVRLVLGEGWEATAAALRILAFVPVFIALGEIGFSALRAVGRLAGYATVQWVTVAGIVAAIALGVPWGLPGVACGMLAVRGANAFAVARLAAAAVGLPGGALLARLLPWTAVVVLVLGAEALLPWPRASSSAALAAAAGLALGIATLAALLPRLFLTPALTALRDRAVARVGRA